MKSLHNWQVVLADLRLAIFSIGMLFRVYSVQTKSDLAGYIASVICGMSLGLILMRPYDN